MINMDFTQTVSVDTNDQPWVASPKSGVWRKPLAREEAERGHATSIVRYEPGASFHSHNHPGGEEILVLEGTFSDETGDFGRGTYFRNPAGFVHAPFSKEGCLILVKLHQFDADDTARLSVQIHEQSWTSFSDGVKSLTLHTHKTEQVALYRIADGATLDLSSFQSIEFYLMSGKVVVNEGDARYGEGVWLRSPQLKSVTATTDSLLWLKRGHF